MSNQCDVPKEKKSNFFRKHFFRKVMTGIIIVVVLGGCTIIGCNKFISSESKITKIGFEDIGELATQVAYCTETNVTEASRNLFGIKIPFTQSKYIYSYDVMVKAGFDFGEIEWREDKDNSTLEVRLPKARVLDSKIDTDSFRLYHESESIFRQITMQENNDALVALEQNAVDNAVANGLLDNARSNAETILTGFFSNVYNLDNYKIKFIDK